MSRAFVSRARLNLVLVAIMVVFSTIMARLLYLHVWNQEKLVHIVEQNRQKFDILNARRGNIVDTRGNILATTETKVSVGADPQIVSTEDRTKWKALSEILNLDLNRIEEKFTQKTRTLVSNEGKEIRLIRWQKLADSINEETYEKIKKLEIKGVYGNQKYERVYPLNSFAPHLLGFVNKEGKAVCGTESYMDFYLKGQDGWVETERDGRKRELAQFRTREVKAVDGAHVELSIDMMVQNAIEDELNRIVKKMNPKAVSIIVSEPSTGFILGLANYPSFNPNKFWESDVDNHRNRAITDVFEPGSPFKSITASAAVNENIVNLEEIYDCSITKIEYKGRIVSLPKDHKPYDKLSFKDVLKKSSNRGVAQIAMKLGDQKLYDYAKAFGWGEKTGFGPGGEVAGTLHDPKNWDGLTISRLPMGHALSGTAIQLHYAMSVFANQGILMQPQVVKRIFDNQGNTLANFRPKARRRVITEKTAKTMSNLLKEVVGPEGTSKEAAIQDFHVAGKSGTSQKLINGCYSHNHHVSSFSGFFPAEDPRVLITVVIDQAEIGSCAYGGIVAAPAFKSVGEKLIQHLNIQPSNFNNQMVALKGR